MLCFSSLVVFLVGFTGDHWRLAMPRPFTALHPLWTTSTQTDGKPHKSHLPSRCNPSRMPLNGTRWHSIRPKYHPKSNHPCRKPMSRTPSSQPQPHPHPHPHPRILFSTLSTIFLTSFTLFVSRLLLILVTRILTNGALACRRRNSPYLD